MALNLDNVNRSIDPIVRHYTWKDVVLYALGIGSGFHELDYCYEKNLKVLPTFAMPAIMDFFWRVGEVANINPMGALHGEQELILHHPLPQKATLTTTGHITHMFDKGKDKGALIVAESDTVDETGTRLFTSILTVFSRLDGGFGGVNSPKKAVAFPDRNADRIVQAFPGADQPLLYRLSGDVFELHVDPEFAKLAGFKGPIVHGLCTMGYACRALLSELAPMEPQRVRGMGCRFSRPLYPGASIETHIWKTGQGTALWKTLNSATGEIIIDQGTFRYEA